MLNKVKLFIIGALSLIFIALPAAPTAALDCTNVTTTQQALQCGTNGANGGSSQTPDQATSHFNSIIRTILNILSATVGILAVVMIIVAGVRFTTSGGSAEKVKSAKSALMYAIIGLAIAALAKIIVQFVLNKAVHS